MKTLPNIKIVFCLLFLTSTSVHARLCKEYIQWSEGQFMVPTEIKKVTDASGLQPFLDSKHEFTRMAAVRRFEEIEGPNSLRPLLALFAKEPAAMGLDVVPLVKLEIVRTLGRIGTNDAKSALLGILDSLWKKGPILPKRKNKNGYSFNDKRYYYLDRDFSTIVPLLLETLDRWNKEEDVFNAIQTIANSEDVKKFYTQRNGIGQKAWEVYLKGKIDREGIGEEVESAMYLLNFMKDLKKRLSYGKFEYMQDEAAFVVLQKHKKTTLSSLVGNFEKELRKEVELSPDSERNDSLRYMISCIKTALKKKTSQTQGTIVN